ncbi:threonine synthase [Actinopolyspora xinjiangensis]|uniref:Threonine synthase n=1 Tax=Actinopolyspora xinjiangensis TaxID=405564 RepID=A0A1H0QV84_9ACTN|nr:pyridoxal-phosphate dependent enzyme [Actinopolyspora xinjiangensis]SDP21231.1 threonine synthase [Actinopolyspora xinjiangensis]
MSSQTAGAQPHESAGRSESGNAELRGLRCVRCGRLTPPLEGTEGCADCRAEGVPAALLAEHDLTGVDGAELVARWSRRRDGMWSYRELLPVPHEHAVTLREGATPLVPLASKAYEGQHRVLFKDERRNPTGSFKDRFYSAAVSWAARRGFGTVALASSGNAGVSAAAYAALAGLDCVVVTAPDIADTWRGLIELHGGRPVRAADVDDRWNLLRSRAEAEGWAVLTNTSTVPVSSLWVGIEGYKTMAYEIVEELGDAPEAVVVPVSRGDGFAGLWAGFRELCALGIVGKPPRMIAAERYPSLSTALRRDLALPPEQSVDPDSLASSIGNPQGTVMSLRVLRESGGTAIPCSEEELRAAADRLARAGVAAELSSAAPLVAADRLWRDGELTAGDRVVTVITSQASHQPAGLP